MPLTKLQEEVAVLLAANRTPDSHLAGGAALHFKPQSKRYSNDLDYFNDSVERVATAFKEDQTTLSSNGFKIKILMAQPGFVRAEVSQNNESTKIEWSHDSAWRFMPAIKDKKLGYLLDPIDLSINKLLALAGRDEARDYLDIMFILEEILPLGALCWAAVGKDPGFTPLSMLSLLRRRGKYRKEDFARLMLNEEPDLPSLKQIWLEALEQAEHFVSKCPPEELGCLYYSTKLKKFVEPKVPRVQNSADILIHHGRPGGVLPLLEEVAELSKNRT